MKTILDRILRHPEAYGDEPYGTLTPDAPYGALMTEIPVVETKGPAGPGLCEIFKDLPNVKPCCNPVAFLCGVGRKPLCVEHRAYWAQNEKVEVIPGADPVLMSKYLRQRLDELLQLMKGPGARKSRNMSLSITHLEDAILRQGMDLKDMKAEGLAAGEDPYPEGYQLNKVIEKTADGLKI